jgi:phospholipase/lecithinase/hemolysin
MDYAVGGAVVNVTLWPSKSTADDFVSQVARFLAQDNGLDPATTLYTSFFGINDWGAANKDGDHLPEAAADYLALVEKLRGPPTNAQYWLALDAYGRYTADAKGDAYKQAIFDGLGQMGTHSNHAQKLEYAFVDLKTLWNGVLETPGYQAFGYTNDTSCLVSTNSIVGACADPDHTFYWIPEHPSKQTHRIMADYIEQVLYRC